MTASVGGTSSIVRVAATTDWCPSPSVARTWNVYGPSTPSGASLGSSANVNTVPLTLAGASMFEPERSWGETTPGGSAIVTEIVIGAAPPSANHRASAAGTAATAI